MRSTLRIEIEGIDGAGKSTQVALLKKRLEAEKHPTQVLRSPGGTEFGEAMRPVVLGPLSRPATSDLLIIAGTLHANVVQAQANAEVGISTIFDRGLSSFYGYQLAEGVPETTINAALKIAELDPASTPALDIHILLDIDYETASDRLADKKLDRWEALGKDYFDTVRELYLKRPYNETVIDATQSIEAVHELIWKLVNEKLKEEK